MNQFVRDTNLAITLWQPVQLVVVIPLPIANDFESPSDVAQLAMLEQRDASGLL